MHCSSPYGIVSLFAMRNFQNEGIYPKWGQNPPFSRWGHSGGILFSMQFQWEGICGELLYKIVGKYLFRLRQHCFRVPYNKEKWLGAGLPICLRLETNRETYVDRFVTFGQVIEMLRAWLFGFLGNFLRECSFSNNEGVEGLGNWLF